MNFLLSSLIRTSKKLQQRQNLKYECIRSLPFCITKITIRDKETLPFDSHSTYYGSTNPINAKISLSRYYNEPVLQTYSETTSEPAFNTYHSIQKRVFDENAFPHCLKQENLTFIFTQKYTFPTINTPSFSHSSPHLFQPYFSSLNLTSNSFPSTISSPFSSSFSSSSSSFHSKQDSEESSTINQSNSIPTSSNSKPKNHPTSLTHRASWLGSHITKNILPFAHLARLDKPIGTWLLAWPCFWSIAIASPPHTLPDLHLLSLFGIGSILLRGAGCTVNDILDRDIDAKVLRTQSRPLASGQISLLSAFSFLAIQLLAGLQILLQLNFLCQVMGASSLLLVFTYPLMKRFTYWPQAFLGLTFNWGCLMGYCAVKETIDPSIVLPLYMSSICWTIVYDTIYAHQDKVDDLKVGVKSTALFFGKKNLVWLSGFAISSIFCLNFVGNAAQLGWPFHSSLLFASTHLAWQIFSTDFNNRDDCSRKFCSNKWYGAIIFLGITLGKFF